MENSAAVTIDEANFDNEVTKSAQPVLVDFWAEWCGPCKMIAPILDEIAKEKAGAVKVAKVNVDDNQSLSARYNVRAIPTLLVLQERRAAGSGHRHDEQKGFAQPARRARLTRSVRPARLERATYSFGGCHSIQLSYGRSGAVIITAAPESTTGRGTDAVVFPPALYNPPQSRY